MSRAAFIAAMREAEAGCPCAERKRTTVKTHCLFRGDDQICRCQMRNAHARFSRCLWPNHAAHRKAVEAFADARCAADKEDMRIYAHDHVGCRAALAKEVFGDA